MRAPCVIGRQLPQAEAILGVAGLRAALVKETRSPKGAPSGPLRVVRQRDISEGIELVTAASLPLVERKDCHD
jgi:hypothetical protein